MKSRFIYVGLLISLVALSSACESSEPGSFQSDSPEPSATVSPIASATPSQAPSDVVKAGSAPIELSRGSTGNVELVVSISKGYHINANPASEYLIPTELTLEPSDILTPGKAVYPKAIVKSFKFSDKPLAVYEDEVRITMPVRASREAPSGEHKLDGSLRVQACDDEVCFPPRTMDVAITVIIK